MILFVRVIVGSIMLESVLNDFEKAIEPREREFYNVVVV